MGMDIYGRKPTKKTGRSYGQNVLGRAITRGYVEDAHTALINRIGSAASDQAAYNHHQR